MNKAPQSLLSQCGRPTLSVDLDLLCHGVDEPEIDDIAEPLKTMKMKFPHSTSDDPISAILRSASELQQYLRCDLKLEARRQPTYDKPCEMAGIWTQAGGR